MTNAPAHEFWRLAGEALNFMFGKRRPVKFEEDSGWLLASGEQSADLNCGLIANSNEGERRLLRYLARFRDLKVPFLICMAEGVATNLATTAQGFGMVPIGELPLMVRRGETQLIVTLADVDTEFVQTQEGLAAYQSFAAAEFGVPENVLKRMLPSTSFTQENVRFVLARRDEELCGVAACTTHRDDAGVMRVGIWSMATSQEHRRQGVATAILAQIFETFAGAKEFYLLSTTDGRLLYEKAGFETVATGTVFAGRYA